MTPSILKRIFQLLTGVLLGLAAALWLLRPDQGTSTPDSQGYFLSQSITAPAFTLTSQDGVPVSSEDFEGKLLVVFFGYTFCPDVCPLTLSKLSRAFSEMEEDGQRIQVLLISVDPERDTPQRLKTYLASFHPSFLGLTGTEDEIRDVATGFGAFFAANGTGDQYTVDHTARTFVVTPAGRIPLTFPITATSAEMARDLAILLEDLEP